MRVAILDPLAPRVAAGEGRVCLVPFDNQLLKVARPHKPHLRRSERVKEEVQPPVCDVGQERRTRISGSAEVGGGDGPRAARVAVFAQPTQRHRGSVLGFLGV